MYFGFPHTWFIKVNKNSWTERNIYFFEEVENDTDLKLFDKSRNVEIKICNNGSECYLNDILVHTNKNTRYIPSEITVINKNQKIGVVMLYTDNMKEMCQYSERNITEYCKKHNYTCYVYRESITDSHPTWNKPLVLLDNIMKHGYIMWIDSDAIFTNFDIKIENIIDKHQNNLLVCDDIGKWKFNAGVQIWKNCEWSIHVLNSWWNCEHLDHLQGGDQIQLIKILENIDENKENYGILDQTVFNCHPKKHRDGMFVLHLMGMSTSYRISAMKHWNSRLIR